jgi:DNA-binding transcriptional LysR family regulator
MSWDDLRVVLALHRTGSLSAAARALGMDRTTAARRLKALEEGLGARLLAGGTRGLRPTPVAALAAARAAEMEAAAAALSREVSGEAERVAGLVRVSATEALGTRVLAPALAALAARHPGLTVRLGIEAATVSLARGEAEVAVRLLAPVEPTTAGRRVASIAYGAYAARRRAARRRARTETPLLVWSAPISGEETERLRAALPGARVALEANSTAALVEAAAAGAGVAVLPRFVGDGDPRLALLELPVELPASELWVLVHRDLRRVARVAAVYEAVERALAAARPALEGRR